MGGRKGSGKKERYNKTKIFYLMDKFTGMWIYGLYGEWYVLYAWISINGNKVCHIHANLMGKKGFVWIKGNIANIILTLLKHCRHYPNIASTLFLSKIFLIIKIQTPLKYDKFKRCLKYNLHPNFFSCNIIKFLFICIGDALPSNRG
jgi:hypothetical protein